MGQKQHLRYHLSQLSHACDSYIRYLQEEFQLSRRLRDCTDYRSLEECHFSAHSFYHFYGMKYKKPVETQGNASGHSRTPSLNDYLSHHSSHSGTNRSTHSAQYSMNSQHSRRSFGGASQSSMPGDGDSVTSFQNTSFLNRPLRNRAAINHKIKWDGNILKFDEVFQNVHGHLTQVGVNYLLFPDVMNNYLVDPHLAYSYIPATKGISEAQFEHDREYLFGVLQSVCKYGVGAKHLHKHRKTQDGLAAYITLMNEYAHGGDVTVRATYYRKMIHARWNPNQPLLQYLTNLQTAYVHLSELNEIFEDHKQISNTVQNFSGTHLHQFVFNTARNPDVNGNFDQFCRVLQEYAHSENYGALTSSRRHAKRVNLDPFWEEVEGMPKEEEMDKPEDAEYEMLRSAFQFATRKQLRNESYSIPPNAWKLLESLDPGVLIKFQAKRKEIDEKKKNTTGIPKQYPKNTRQANVASTQETADDMSEASSEMDLDGLISDMNDLYHSFIGNTRTIRVTADFQQRKPRMAGNITTSPYSLAACDSGADTILFGPGWRHMHDTMRKANVVGFEQANLERKGLVIGSRCTVATISNGTQVILVAHEGVDNSKHSDITLLSEYQMRDFVNCRLSTQAPFDTRWIKGNTINLLEGP